jgi:hypothetical protein
MVSEYLHTDAGHYKENHQCRRDYCSDPLAIECLRGHRLPPRDSHWEVKSLKILSIELKRSLCKCKDVSITDHQLEGICICDEGVVFTHSQYMLALEECGCRSQGRRNRRIRPSEEQVVETEIASRWVVDARRNDGLSEQDDRGAETWPP